MYFPHLLPVSQSFACLQLLPVPSCCVFPNACLFTVHVFSPSIACLPKFCLSTFVACPQLLRVLQLLSIPSRYIPHVDCFLAVVCLPAVVYRQLSQRCFPAVPHLSPSCCSSQFIPQLLFIPRCSPAVVYPYLFPSCWLSPSVPYLLFSPSCPPAIPQLFHSCLQDVP